MKAGALALLVLLLAGCVGQPAPVPTTSGATFYDALEKALGNPIDPDHDHSKGSLHNHSLNLQRVARVTGRDGAPPDGEFYGETAVKDGFAYLSRYGPESGLVIFDVHDVEHPKRLGSVRLDEGFEPDVEISDDGHWAFWETQRFPVTPTTPALPSVGANLPHGVHIVDISDKSNPKWAGYYPVYPDGPHSITYANIAGRHILFLSVYAMAYAFEGVEVPTAQRVVITELDTSNPAAATLKELATYIEPGATGTGKGGMFPHDVSISKHPLTGQTLAYVAYWNVGLVLLDVGDPANPKRVATYTDFGPAAYRNAHMARAFPQLIDGKHVTMVEPEVGGAKDTGYATFVDTTDPAHPTYLSSWLLPGNLTSQGLRFSPHYFDLQQGRAVMANYHAGLWVIDVHDHANLLHPRSVGFAEFASDRSGASGFVFPFEEGAFDAWWVPGAPDYVVAGDFFEGLAVYKYTGPAPPAVTAPLG